MKKLIMFLVIFAPLMGESSKHEYFWYDGKVKRKIYLRPKLLAQFDKKKGNATIKNLDSDAKIILKRGPVQIWKFSKVAPKLSKGAYSTLAKNFSEVFSDNKIGGRRRSLPGNIIVYLNKEWSNTQAQKWAEGKHLKILKRLEIKGQNVFVIKTSPGMQNIELANRLQESVDVISAMPNWWVEVFTR